MLEYDMPHVVLHYLVGRWHLADSKIGYNHWMSEMYGFLFKLSSIQMRCTSLVPKGCPNHHSRWRGCMLILNASRRLAISSDSKIKYNHWMSEMYGFVFKLSSIQTRCTSLVPKGCPNHHSRCRGCILILNASRRLAISSEPPDMIISYSQKNWSRRLYDF